MFKLKVKVTATGKKYVMTWGTKKHCIEFAEKLNKVTKNDWIKVIREKDEEVVFEIKNEEEKIKC